MESSIRQPFLQRTLLALGIAALILMIVAVLLTTFLDINSLWSLYFFGALFMLLGIIAVILKCKNSTRGTFPAPESTAQAGTPMYHHDGTQVSGILQETSQVSVSDDDVPRLNGRDALRRTSSEPIIKPFQKSNLKKIFDDAS